MTDFQKWRDLEECLGVDFPTKFRNTFWDNWGGEFEEVIEELPSYLKSHPECHRKMATLNTLAKAIRLGDWPLSPTVTPMEVHNGVYMNKPIGFVDDVVLQGLPSLIQSLVEYRLQGTYICTDFAIAGALATVSACCGNRVRVRAWGNTTFANEYFLLVGPPRTSFKSSVIKTVRELLSEAYPTCIAPDEGSVEGLVRHLREKPSAMWLKVELANLLIAIKGQDYMRHMRPFLLTMFDHTGVYNRTIANNIADLIDPAVSLLSGIQPKVFGEELMSPLYIDSGFTNRLLVVRGDGIEDKWPRIEDAEVLKGQLVTRLRQIANGFPADIYADHIEDDSGIWRGIAVKEFGEYGDVVAQGAHAHIIKVAAILQAADSWPKPHTYIDPRWVAASIALLHRWFTSATALVAETLTKYKGEIIRRDIVAFLSAHGKAGVGEISKSLQLSTRQLKDHIETLEERNTITKVRTSDEAVPLEPAVYVVV